MSITINHASNKLKKLLLVLNWAVVLHCTANNNKIVKLVYSIFTLSPKVSRFKSTNNKSQLYHTDIHVQVLIAFNN